MAEQPDYYADLGLSQRARRDEIEEKYRQLIEQEQSDESLEKINAAYEVLSDWSTRQKYDFERSVSYIRESSYFDDLKAARNAPDVPASDAVENIEEDPEPELKPPTQTIKDMLGPILGNKPPVSPVSDASSIEPTQVEAPSGMSSKKASLPKPPRQKQHSQKTGFIPRSEQFQSAPKPETAKRSAASGQTNLAKRSAAKKPATKIPPTRKKNLQSPQPATRQTKPKKSGWGRGTAGIMALIIIALVRVVAGMDGSNSSPSYPSYDSSDKVATVYRTSTANGGTISTSTETPNIAMENYYSMLAASSTARANQSLEITVTYSSNSAITSISSNTPSNSQLKQTATAYPEQLQDATPVPTATQRRLNYRGSDLTYESFWAEDLQGTDFSEATLRSVNLSDTDLWQANFEGAIMNSANLQGANLTEANLQGADLSRTFFDTLTILPDGTMWSREIDMERFTDSQHPDFWRPDQDGVLPWWYEP